MKTTNLMPGVAQVVAISVSHSDEGLDGVDVLLLHFSNARAGSEQSEPRQSLNIRVSLQLWAKSSEALGQNTKNKSTTRELLNTTCMEKMQAIRMAQRIPSRHSEATSVSSQS